jgi:hypothetical protein
MAMVQAIPTCRREPKFCTTNDLHDLNGGHYCRSGFDRECPDRNAYRQYSPSIDRQRNPTGRQKPDSIHEQSNQN